MTFEFCVSCPSCLSSGNLDRLTIIPLDEGTFSIIENTVMRHAMFRDCLGQHGFGICYGSWIMDAGDWQITVMWMKDNTFISR